MSDVLQAIQDIKIPYATEGVIRTAQLDDTVAPEDSAQLAVNLNFDRVGAMQTRPGVTSYADQLVDAIKNYGTLRNNIVPPGYEWLYPFGDVNEIADTFSDPAAVKVSDEKVTVFWRGVDNDGYAQNLRIDLDTGSFTPIGTPFEFETASNGGNRAILVNNAFGDAVMNIWTGPNGDGWAQIFIVEEDDITAPTSAYEFDAADGTDITVATVDSSHVIVFYTGSTGDGLATILAYDLSGNISEPGSTLTWDSGDIFGNSCAPLGDGIHFVNFWTDSGGGGYAQCFAVNTGTWAITALSTPLNYDATGFRPSAQPISTTRVIAGFLGSVSGRWEAQTFAVDPSTFAVTESGTSVLLAPTGGNDMTIMGFGDGEHFVAFYSRNIGDGYVQMFERDPVTDDLSLVGAPLDGYDFANNGYMAPLQLSSNKMMVVWGNEDRVEGKGAMFISLGAVESGRWLYAASGDEIFNTAPGDGGTWTSRRSGLAEVSKPRFDQYLGYIWMVNGNQQIGGDPVATSNGGAFGTDLVPEDFPKGDYIQCGFEGRVWVANKTLGVIYYTDIVQFTPPSIYNLSYNPDVNFITTISPDTGETITALMEVPRALLVFTENSITRIYGASSIDAYPAYNVGTFSQESIIQTKTGIFFHHSSGFYQFDYGSQPVEISRRIIDFVQAIPRSYYEEITGVWDGFDNVEWHVGQVVVEGVVFSECVLRYTISTQVWTVYDYPNIEMTAMIYYDDGVNLSHLVGDAEGRTGRLDVGDTDYGEPFYFEWIDRWRSYTQMYYHTKAISGLSVYSENAAGANVMFQKQKTGPNAWEPIFTISEDNNSLSPNTGTNDFDVGRLRIAGTTKGARVVIHGVEITQLTVKGQETN
jgi:hypothetical protein